MARHYVYMVECADGSLYTGYTTHPKRRIVEHNRGIGSRYTRTRRPVKLVYLEPRASRSDGLRREKALKRLDRNRKLLLSRGYLALKKP